MCFANVTLTFGNTGWEAYWTVNYLCTFSIVNVKLFLIIYLKNILRNSNKKRNQDKVINIVDKQYEFPKEENQSKGTEQMWKTKIQEHLSEI